MAFGQNHRRDSEYDENKTGISETQGYIDLDDDVKQTITANEGSGRNSKNVGGAKQWICNHCKGKYTSSYTRIHVHFFGAPLGKKAEIRRCPVVAKDRDTYERLQKRVKDAEKLGVSNVVTDNATNCKLAGKEIEKRDWAKQGDEHTRTIAQLVVDTIRDDDFWNEVENILKITKPIFLMVKFYDGEGPKMGEIYEKMDNMIGEIKDVMKESIYASYFLQVEQILLKRWEKMNIPLHCLGFALSPRFYDTRFLETLASGGIRRKAPNLDKEVVQVVMEAFSRIFENRDEERMLREQFATFHMKKSLYSLPAAQLDAVTMEAIDWWSTYGAQTPELVEVAKKILSQPITETLGLCYSKATRRRLYVQPLYAAPPAATTPTGDSRSFAATTKTAHVSHFSVSYHKFGDSPNCHSFNRSEAITGGGYKSHRAPCQQGDTRRATNQNKIIHPQETTTANSESKEGKRLIEKKHVHRRTPAPPRVAGKLKLRR
ncbi:Detected protein of unknown function [Hibiscus syriacus]|uniref:HAT C-terminal dimerisation domain-containing protein n=1 Tax=Hibiscus syriacus TaxID=106335 RepID=A0A6A2XIU8_HIBSY|nr:Detected protein of unknown function [Hibiscus syriacus]